MMKSAGHLFIAPCMILAAMISEATQLYNERYRPQYHFTPQEGWIGDPDGLIRFRGDYHLFWWGHAISRDLVYWKELPWPMKGDDNSFMYFTGSVVVDKENTGGWGTSNQPAMVAVYTAHERGSDLESQRISISTNYTDFHYYEGNPVLNLNTKSFRDPDVFWHEPSGAWIMVITLPDERKIHFYASNDLKSWRFLSDFGPMASQAPLWETPCLFQLPLNGDTNDMKWVLTVALGPNKMDFFVGNFDGRTFKLDSVDQAYLTRGKGMDGDVWENFEGRSIYEWSVTGKAFGDSPSHSSEAGRKEATGYLGRGLGSSVAGGKEAKGTLKSPPFTIERNCINFLIGGGNHPRETCVNLVVSGRVVRTATGRNSRHMLWTGWDVSEYKGQEAHLSIVDERSDRWGFIHVDHVMFSDVLYDIGREHANWIDWGLDFYAARIYRDYDGGMTSTVWLGWMGNWDYANQVPTSWGRGVQSIPRELSLVTRAGRYALQQKPIPALQKLRGAPVEISSRNIEGIVVLNEFRPKKNTYELIAEFALEGDHQIVGLNLCVGGSDKVVIRYDAATANVTFDRRASGNVGFSDRFPRTALAPLSRDRDTIKFHIFVDLSSIEIFINDGQAVMTSLMFPDPGSVGLEIFSPNGISRLNTLTACELSTIWADHMVGDK